MAPLGRQGIFRLVGQLKACFWRFKYSNRFSRVAGEVLGGVPLLL
jgi:hypothetical protein